MHPCWNFLFFIYIKKNILKKVACHAVVKHNILGFLYFEENQIKINFPLIVCSVHSAEGYKTIHHLCTTPASQVVPVELQLASRICHTQKPITATAQFNQQREALGHISVHPDTQRYKPGSCYFF